MAGICFGEHPDSDWIVAGWAFRHALRDLVPYAAGNPAFLEALTLAGHIGFLNVNALDDDLRAEVVGAVRAMCRDILDGTRLSGIKESFPDDLGTQNAYREGIRGLLATVESSERSKM